MRVLGLIEARLAQKPQRHDDHVYRGAILARLSLQLEDPAQRRRVLATGLDLMRTTSLPAWTGQVARLQVLYAGGITTALLPQPPVSAVEAWQALYDLLKHPGFNTLHPRRRAVAEAAHRTLAGRRHGVSPVHTGRTAMPCMLPQRD